jgi:predicted dinucleotide-binding enzyme
MRIGIIGVGRVGGTLTRHLAVAGHSLAVANSRGPETLSALTELFGFQVQPSTIIATAAFADVAVVAIPFGRYRELPVAELAGKPVIDATNYDPGRDGRVPALDEDQTTSSELIQEHLADAHVVKAFNAITPDDLHQHAFRERLVGRRAIPVSGDDIKAKKATTALVEEIGFDPVDVGRLAVGGRTHQPGTFIFSADLTAIDVRAHLRLST